MKELVEISNLISNLKNEEEIVSFLSEILTKNEISVLSKRWRILTFLKQGKTQRQIAKDLNVSLCKVTRGAKILKDSNAVITKYLTKEKNDELAKN